MSPFSKIAGSQEKDATLEEAHLMGDNSSTEGDNAFPRPKRQVSLMGTTLVPWTLSAVLLTMLIASWAFKQSNGYAVSSFERGFSTELS